MGANGLEVGAPEAMLFFKTSLTSNTLPAAQFSVSSVTRLVIPAGSADQTVTIAGGGFGTGDTVGANGMQLAVESR